MQALEDELNELKAEENALQVRTKSESDSDALDLWTALSHQIAALQIDITEQRKSQGNFLVLRGESYVLVQFVFFIALHFIFIEFFLLLSSSS